MINCLLFFNFLSEICYAQVSYDPGYIVGWSGVSQYSSSIMAPYDIILDAPNSQTLPSKFRTPHCYGLAGNPNIMLDGFKDLRMSGSAQFSQWQLEELTRYLVKNHRVKLENIIVVDLREEPHGIINGDAVTFHYGPLHALKNKSPAKVLASDQQRINMVRTMPYIILNMAIKSEAGMPENKRPMVLAVKSAMTEQELATQIGIQYVRIPVTDHFRPDHSDVDQFIDYVERLPSDAWLHFKCRGGKGRTTTFMAIYDMLKNPLLPKEEFIKRQILIHGINLSPTTISGKKSWKSSLSTDRSNFIGRFYEYLHAPNGYGKQKWSHWVRIHYPGMADETYQTNIE